MLLPMLLSQSPEPAITRQPTTMEVVGYQRVQHALPDGTPDLAATDNYYIRTRSQYFLVLDTDTLPVNKEGKRYVVYPERFTREYKIDDQIGELGQNRFDLFKEISYINPEDRGRLQKTSTGRMHKMSFFRPANQRLLQYFIRTVVEQVEIRSEGTKSAIRTSRHSHWAVSSSGWTTGKPFVPRVEPMVMYEAGPKHVFEEPVLGYGAYKIPQDYEL